MKNGISPTGSLKCTALLDFANKRVQLYSFRESSASGSLSLIKMSNIISSEGWAPFFVASRKQLPVESTSITSIWKLLSTYKPFDTTENDTRLYDVCRFLPMRVTNPIPYSKPSAVNWRRKSGSNAVGIRNCVARRCWQTKPPRVSIICSSKTHQFYCLCFAKSINFFLYWLWKPNVFVNLEEGIRSYFLSIKIIFFALHACFVW